MNLVDFFPILAICAAIAEAFVVTDLTRSTFDYFINKHEVVMVEFYAPWCQVCKDLEPIYEQTASTHITDKNIKFARVNCVDDNELCDKWRTPIYPTLRVFKGLENQEIYNGRRTPSEMIDAVEWFWLPDNDTVVEFQPVKIKENLLWNRDGL